MTKLANRSISVILKCARARLTGPVDDFYRAEVFLFSNASSQVLRACQLLSIVHELKHIPRMSAKQSLAYARTGALLFWLAAGILDAPAQAPIPVDPVSNSETRSTETTRDGNPIPSNPMIAHLQQRLSDRPGHADSWRLLGKLWQQEGQPALAEHHFRKALELDHENVAAHADLFDLLTAMGRTAEAQEQADVVLQLGPITEYADEIRTKLGIPSHELPAGPEFEGATNAIVPLGASSLAPFANDESFVQQASLEVQAFDGSDELADELRRREQDVLREAKNWRAFWEAALLYNSNISLTPISRELANADAGGFQATLSPDLEFLALNRELRRSGPFFRGLFNLNESQHSDLNLGSFQPGWFGEWDTCFGSWELTHRAEYVYAIDMFAGDKIGDRNSLMFSTTAINPSLDVYYGYVRISYSNFTDDGATPAVTSLDGNAMTFGLSRFISLENQLITMLTFGGDFDLVDTEGSDYRYQGGTLHSSATMDISDAWELICGGGLGYRDYSDFTGTPSRDELVLRSSARLRRRWTESVYSDLIFGYDRFASENDRFDSERFEGGVATIWMY